MGLYEIPAFAGMTACKRGSHGDCPLFPDDLNTPLALSRLSAIEDGATLRASAAVMGLLEGGASAWFQGAGDGRIDALVAARGEAKARRDFAEADRIRAELAQEGIMLEDGPQGTSWRRA